MQPEPGPELQMLQPEPEPDGAVRSAELTLPTDS